MSSDNDDSIEAMRTELALAYLGRANTAADVVRALLFTTSAAAIGFIVETSEPLAAHLCPMVLIGLGWLATLWSWDLQKGKAVRRFELLRDKRIQCYRDMRSPPNFWIDRLSACSSPAASSPSFVSDKHEFAAARPATGR